MQGLLEIARLPMQAEPSGSAERNEDFSEQSAVDLVAGGAISCRDA